VEVGDINDDNDDDDCDLTTEWMEYFKSILSPHYESQNSETFQFWGL